MRAHPLKIVRIEAEDILFDPDEESRMLTNACFRNGVIRRVTGVCDSGDGTIILPLELADGESAVPMGYRFAPLPDFSFEGVSAELQIRHTHGLSLIGTFRPDEKTLWGLYARFPQKK